ncbi:hypothetical protein SAMN04490244_101187 [Tranquillimonas rosea]|uniref:Uncharacterized protein n=1 Tax=Tranquillimonas rosea TaxID=641238 RepID=A0A1H9PIK6_9RHOB|nr:hypothetical protein [Tranquillimonas rosea]SER47685.1 hypothetical protein SAMN04490244_101187 [Tranquillimonas rosea]
MLIEHLQSYGHAVVSFIIGIAQRLTKSDSSPGLVAMFLVACLIFCGAAFFWRTWRQQRAIQGMQSILDGYAGIPEFAEGFETFRSDLKTQCRRSRESFDLWQAWDEYAETIVPDDVDGPLRLRNSIRPSSFINAEDLGFGPGFYRILPNLFVSVGLLLTFLGLVAALFDFSHSMAAAGPGSDAGLEMAMTNFMQIASAKFVMSLVGLFCSILFTMLLRQRLSRIDRALHKLCLSIERRLVFVSLEDLGFRQLKAATEQREHLREIGFAMVAELRKPLEALPEQITTSIAERMDPIFEKVSSMGASSVEGLVGDLSSQLSHSVGNSLNRASESLGEASDRIGQMVDRMNASNAQAGEGLQTALGQLSGALQDLRQEVSATGTAASSAMTKGAEELLAVMNETLTGIRDNTAEGAGAMSAAADDLRKSAEGFRQQLAAAVEDGTAAVQGRMAETSEEAGQAITGAGTSLLTAFEATSRQIAQLGTEVGDSVSGEILSKLETVSDQLQEMARAIERGAAEAQSAASGLSDGARSIAGASTTFDTASRTLVGATEPLRTSHDQIEQGLRRLDGTVERVSEALTMNSRQMAEDAGNVLRTAQTALGNEREGIAQSLEATRHTLRQLSEEAARLDDIDEMLGRALAAYSSQLEAALGTAQDHVVQMRDTLAPGLDTLKGVVEQAESFLPAQRRSA